MVTQADQDKLAGYIATYLSIPASKRTPAQVAALATDQATYARQAAMLGGTSSPVQLTTPSASGPVAPGTTSGPTSMATGLGTISPTVLLVGGGALLVVLMLRRK